MKIIFVHISLYFKMQIKHYLYILIPTVFAHLFLLNAGLH